MKKILLLGGVGGMSYSTRLAKDLGYETYCADYFPNSQAKEAADHKYCISTTDFDAISNIIEKENISAVFSGFSDVNIYMASKLCKKYNLPHYISEEKIIEFQNKIEFKDMCKKYGILSPKCYFENDFANIIYPIIVKPSDSYASKGIMVCKNYDELLNAYKNAKKQSKNNRAIVEEYIEGKEIMMHFVMLNKKVKITSILERKKALSFSDYSKPIAPAVISNTIDYQFSTFELENKLENMFVDNGLNNVVGFLQGIEKNNEIYFFEPAIRFGGNVSELFNIYANNVNIIRKFIEFSFTGIMDDSDIDSLDSSFNDGYYCNATIFMKQGKIKEIIEEEYFERIKQIKDVQKYYHIGETINDDDLLTYKAISYRIIFVCNNKNEARDILLELKKHIFILNDENCNMLDWQPALDNL